MRRMKVLFAAPLLLSALLVQAQQNKADEGDGLVLDGKAARLVVTLKGGVIRELRLQGGGRNPLHSLGHFLCLDRWGQPSAAEAKNGMPFHGEASQVEWQVLRPPEPREGAIEAEMTAALPLAGLEIKRRVRLSETAAFFVVREEVTNKNKLGRVYNMVQHPTIGPPFLNETTLVDANAGKGFMQGSPLPNPERPAVNWPQALDGGHAVDMRRLAGKDTPNVVSYVIDEKYGWTTACNPEQGLLIGYLWKTADYPWFNAWRNVADGKPAARGLEFGTTGLHQPFPVLVAKGRIFGRSLYEYLDADQTVSRSYAGFLFRIPADYRGVSQVTFAGGQLTLRERGAGGRRDLQIEVGDLFPG
jgi:hypothetical protein